jgi:hypothetical protein
LVSGPRVGYHEHNDCLDDQGILFVGRGRARDRLLGRAIVHPSLSHGYACPAGTAVPAYYSYKKRWRVLVEVCLVKNNRTYYCSGWK